MKMSWIAVGLVAAAIAAHAQNRSTAQIIAAVVAQKNPRLVYVVPGGQFFHRHDHIVATGVLELKPEEAIARLYVRCPECLPPRSLAELDAEAKGSRKVSKYYQLYLSERVDAKILNVPPGADPVKVAKVDAQPFVLVPPDQANVRQPGPAVVVQQAPAK